MPYYTLISAAELVKELDNPKWVLFDCRFNLRDVSAGWEGYQRGHIPGARYAHLERDLSGSVTPATGRHPLPTPQQLTEKLNYWGVDTTKQIVAYDDTSGTIAGRLWWLLRWLGHENVAVLDGGLQHWEKAGYPLTVTPPEPTPAHFEPHVQSGKVVTSEDVEHASLRGYILLDARTPERFRGELEPIDLVAGHIPGAKNHPFSQNLDEEGKFLSPEMLALAFQSQVGRVSPEQIVCMCGSGVTACHNLLALEHAGFQGARLYAGSWSEWITDGTRPVATGDEVHD